MWEVGDSYNGVQAAIDANNRARDAGLMNAFGIINNAFGQRNAVNEANRNFAFRKAAQGEDMRQRALENAFRARQEVDIAHRYADRNALDRDYLGLQKSQLTQNRTSPDYSEAYDAVNKGLLTDLNQVDELFPSLPEEQRSRLRTYMKSANDQYNQSADAAQNFADSLNTQLQAKLAAKKKTAETGLRDHWSLGGMNPYMPSADEITEKLDAITLDDNDISSVMSAAQKHKLANYVTYDPASGRIVSTVGRRGSSKQASSGYTPSAVAVRAPWSQPAPEGSNPNSSFQVQGWQGGDGASLNMMSQPDQSGPAMPSPFYDRVNALIASGMNPRDAKVKAQSEMASR